MVNTERLCMGCMNDNGGEKICPICGYDSSLDNSAQYLSVGTWLNSNRYLIGKVIEENGDAVVYIGWDNDNNTVVNITEYLPAGLSRRSADRLTVSPSDNDAIAFNKGFDEFVQLHTRLSKIKAVGILPVVDVFESNGTVYSVSSTVSSISLKDFLIRNGGTLKWEQVKPLFIPLLSALSELHDVGIVHRGISPDTILVGRDGRLYLTGFSVKSARIANTEFAYKLASGYSAPEQYDIEVESGAACDIYALGAVLFRCIIGATPPDAKERQANDKLTIPANAAQNVSKGALAAIANALKVDPATRIASADRFKKMIEAAAGVVAKPETAEELNLQKKKGSDGKKYAVISSLITAAVFIGIAVAIFFLFDLGNVSNKDNNDDNNATSSVVEPIFSQTNVKFDDNGIEVPDWIGKTYSEAVKELNDQSLELEIVIIGKVYSDSYERGAIVDQTVKGEKVEPNSEIGIYISLGKSSLTMPDLIGRTRDEAMLILYREGFLIDNFAFRERVSNAPSGVVIGMSVDPGDVVSVDEHIIIDYCRESDDTDTPSDIPTSSEESGGIGSGSDLPLTSE